MSDSQGRLNNKIFSSGMWKETRARGRERERECVTSRCNRLSPIRQLLLSMIPPTLVGWVHHPNRTMTIAGPQSMPAMKDARRARGAPALPEGGSFSCFSKAYFPTWAGRTVRVTSRPLSPTGGRYAMAAWNGEGPD